MISRYLGTEDYKFWLNNANHSNLANIPEVLHRYRKYDQQIRNKINAPIGYKVKNLKY